MINERLNDFLHPPLKGPTGWYGYRVGMCRNGAEFMSLDGSVLARIDHGPKVALPTINSPGWGRTSDLTINSRAL